MFSQLLKNLLRPLEGIAYLLLRVAAGLFLVAHGLFKLVGVEGSAYVFLLPWENASFIAFVDELGFPMPTLFATVAMLTEIFGGLLLALGLFTRIACVFTIILMAVITFGVHWENGFWVREHGWEHPMLWLLVFLLFLTGGGGRYSMDARSGRD